jgi:hypothetical protein
MGKDTPYGAKAGFGSRIAGFDRHRNFEQETHRRGAPYPG